MFSRKMLMQTFHIFVFLREFYSLNLSFPLWIKSSQWSSSINSPVFMCILFRWEREDWTPTEECVKDVRKTSPLSVYSFPGTLPIQRVILSKCERDKPCAYLWISWGLCPGSNYLNGTGVFNTGVCRHMRVERNSYSNYNISLVFTAKTLHEEKGLANIFSETAWIQKSVSQFGSVSFISTRTHTGHTLILFTSRYLLAAKSIAWYPIGSSSQRRCDKE